MPVCIWNATWLNWGQCSQRCCPVDHVCSGGNKFFWFWGMLSIYRPSESWRRGAGVISMSQNQLRETAVPNTILLAAWADSLGKSQKQMHSTVLMRFQGFRNQMSWVSWWIPLQDRTVSYVLNSICRAPIGNSSVLLVAAPHQHPTYIFLFFVPLCWSR